MPLALSDKNPIPKSQSSSGAVEGQQSCGQTVESSRQGVSWAGQVSTRFEDINSYSQGNSSSLLLANGADAVMSHPTNRSSQLDMIDLELGENLPCQSQLSTSKVKVGHLTEQKEMMARPFPLVLSSARRVEPVNFIELQEYLHNNRDTILEAASEYGAVLFNGFDIRSGEEWASVLYALGLQEIEYVGGAAVRKLIVGNEERLENPQVFTTNESPPSEPIPFHNELAQTPNPPSHICFYCHKNAAEGGATPLIRSDQIHAWMQANQPELLEKFTSLGVKYIRVVPTEDDPSSALGRSWKSMFHVETREAAEQAMRDQGWEWEWLDNGDCKTISMTLPAVRNASNGNPSFCNQVVAAYTGWIDKRNDPTKAVVFGDGSLLPATQMQQLVDYMQEEQFSSQWQPGQFVIVDNSVTAHAREPFTGKRKIFASIANGVKSLAAKPMTHLVLQSGDTMPSVGFGLWNVPNDKCASVVYNAIESGYRSFDEAADYGNEKACGEGIAKAIDSGLVRREDLWITSKLWNTDHRPEHVEAACKRSMADLGVDHLDLYLIHFPISLAHIDTETRYPAGWLFDPDQSQLGMVEDPVPMSETWQAMESLVDKGLVKNIGLCNVGVSQLRDIISGARIKPSVLQVEIHPYNSQSELLRFCRENGISVTGFSNLGGGSYVDLGMAKPQESCLTEPVVQQIAAEHGKSPAQVVLRWAVQRGIAIVPKSTQPERQRENIDIYDFALTSAEMDKINDLNKNHRFNDPGQFCEQAFNTFYPIYA